MTDTRVRNILREHAQSREMYAALCEKSQRLLVELLESNDIKIHSHSSRVKTHDSLEEKVSKAEKYITLTDVMDVGGLRLITYFSDDVDKIAEIIEKEFDVDKENSIDKRAALDPDRFGYLSLHFVCKFNSSRCSLTEYKRFSDLRFEIQVRSIFNTPGQKWSMILGTRVNQPFPKLSNVAFLDWLAC